MHDRDDQPKPRKNPIASEEALKELGLRYVARFPGSVDHVRRYLKKKLNQAVGLGETTATESRAWIESILAMLQRVQLLDDRAYAESRARVLHRRGRPTRVIAGDLRQRGVDASDATRALDELSDGQPTVDLAAAVRLARRRRLGPWARDADRADRRQKHLATLARSGFSYDIARRVIDAPDATLLEALLND